MAGPGGLVERERELGLLGGYLDDVDTQGRRALQVTESIGNRSATAISNRLRRTDLGRCGAAARSGPGDRSPPSAHLTAPA